MWYRPESQDAPAPAVPLLMKPAIELARLARPDVRLPSFAIPECQWPC